MAVSADPSNRTVSVSVGPVGKKQTRSFTFDRVFGMYSTQDEVFEGVVRPVVEDVSYPRAREKSATFLVACRCIDIGGRVFIGTLAAFCVVASSSSVAGTRNHPLTRSLYPSFHR
jgi:hypothetical protein